MTRACEQCEEERVAGERTSSLVAMPGSLFCALHTGSDAAEQRTRDRARRREVAKGDPEPTRATYCLACGGLMPGQTRRKNDDAPWCRCTAEPPPAEAFVEPVGIAPTTPAQALLEGVCAEHGQHGERVCPQCPSVVENPRIDTEPVRYGARDALNEQLLEMTAELPLELERPADFELALRIFTRLVNWHAWSYMKPERRDGAKPYVVLSTADEHYTSDDELAEARSFFESPSIIVFRALMNLVQEIGHALELCDMNGRGLTSDKLRTALRELVEERAERERKLAELTSQLQEARGALRAGE